MHQAMVETFLSPPPTKTLRRQPPPRVDQRQECNVAKPPNSTKISLKQRLAERAEQRWPQLTSVTVTYRGAFAYVSATLSDGDTLPLCRLRYGGSASVWAFAVYLASKDGYEESILPDGSFSGAPEDALDCACGLYLNDPSAWG